ncbi:ArsR/SmtB family transcription factor [Leifsonia poae]|uniref:ArsR/SmtB family transcription factor n=1 Tax=Leifsonia poae TaxID=110933 RepID=UPI003D6671E9
MDALEAIGDPVRRRFVEYLAAGDAPAGALADLAAAEFAISQPAASRHLRVLRETGVVTSRVDGKQRVYTLDGAAIEAAADWFDRLRDFWPQRLDALETELARGGGTERRGVGRRTAEPRTERKHRDDLGRHRARWRAAHGDGGAELHATPAELWSALTEPERLARWIGRFSVDGHEYRLEMGDDSSGGVVSGRVLACEPERRILVLWQFSGEGQVEATTELEVAIKPVEDDRVSMSLTHRRVQAVSAAAYGAGWEDVLTHLAREVGGDPSPIGDRGYVGEAADPAAFDSALDVYRRVEAGLVRAQMIRSSGKSGVHLERHLDAPVSTVWDAITLPDRIGRWLWPVVEWPDDPERTRALQLGDAFVLGDANVPDSAHAMEVLALEHERLLSFTWGPERSAVTIRLAADGGGTLFVLDQDGIPDVFGAGRLRSAPDFAAGWHSLVDGLVLLLAGLSVPKPEGLWDAAYEVYAELDAREGSSTGG